MQKLLKLVIALLATATLAVTLAGCSGSATIDLKAVTAVIDVRTPDEYAAGHLQGALNIDVENADFTMKIDALKKDGNYVVYCHSGRRAGIAVETMKSSGFSGILTNAGGIDEASISTGLPVVTN
jgi:rhodanese-related sulfurtransferase